MIRLFLAALLLWLGLARPGRRPGKRPDADKPVGGRPFTIRGVTLAGRFDKPLSLWRKITLVYVRRTSVIARTETASDKVAAAIRVDRWPMLRGDKGDTGETSTQYKAAVWSHRRGRSAVIGPDLGVGGRNVVRLDALHHRRRGVNLVLGVAHHRASIEGDLAADRHGGRVGHYRDELETHARITLELAQEVGDALALLVGDYNGNVHRSDVRREIEQHVRPFELVTPIPDGASHRGGRLIDLVFEYTAELPDGWIVRVRWRVGAPTSSSDHRPIMWSVRFYPPGTGKVLRARRRRRNRKGGRR